LSLGDIAVYNKLAVLTHVVDGVELEDFDQYGGSMSRGVCEELKDQVWKNLLSCCTGISLVETKPHQTAEPLSGTASASSTGCRLEGELRRRVQRM